MASGAAATLPLSGIRVLDMTRCVVQYTIEIILFSFLFYIFVAFYFHCAITVISTHCRATLDVCIAIKYGGNIRCCSNLHKSNEKYLPVGAQVTRNNLLNNSNNKYCYVPRNNKPKRREDTLQRSSNVAPKLVRRRRETSIFFFFIYNIKRETLFKRPNS